MSYRVAICDDSQHDAEHVISLLTNWAKKNQIAIQTKYFQSAEAFLFEYEDDKAYDILLLDVEMKGITGIELAKRIRRDNNRSEIVFITSHFEFAGEGYEVDALHYLIKPISADKLDQVLTKAAKKLSVEPTSVVISCDGETVKLYEDDILYIESFLHYIVIHTKDKEYKMKESISVFEEKLSNDFYRIHRSYIASLKHIIRISRTSINIGKAELPLSRGKYDDVNRAFIERN